MHLVVYARRNCIDLDTYAEEVLIDEEIRDRDNEFRIEMVASNADSYFVYIPKDKFQAFIIACQKLQAKGVFD